MKSTRDRIDSLLEASVVGSFTSVGFGIRSRIEHFAPLTQRPGRRVIITGATSGLGRYSALALSELGCDVTAIGRNQERLDDLVLDSRTHLGSITPVACDLSDLEAVAGFAQQWRQEEGEADVVIHNAGALADRFVASAQGFETTLATHLLGPHVLNGHLHLFPDTTVIFVTSGGMYTQAFSLDQLSEVETPFQGSVAYARAKRAQVVLMMHLARIDSCHALAVHPGWTDTPGLTSSLPRFSSVLKPLLRDLSAGSDTLLWAATSDRGEPDAGQLYFDRKPRSIFRLAKTRVDSDTLIEQGRELYNWLNETLAPWLS